MRLIDRAAQDFSKCHLEAVPANFFHASFPLLRGEIDTPTQVFAFHAFPSYASKMKTCVATQELADLEAEISKFLRSHAFDDGRYYAPT